MKQGCFSQNSIVFWIEFGRNIRAMWHIVAKYQLFPCYICPFQPMVPGFLCLVYTDWGLMTSVHTVKVSEIWWVSPQALVNLEAGRSWSFRNPVGMRHLRTDIGIALQSVLGLMEHRLRSSKTCPVPLITPSMISLSFIIIFEWKYKQHSASLLFKKYTLIQTFL